VPSKIVAINADVSHRERVRATRDNLVLTHLSLVDGIARGVLRNFRLPPCFTLDDLQQVGYVALLRAATRFRPRAHPGVPFAAFCRLPVRGAMLESVRRKNWTESTREPLPEDETQTTPAIADSAIDRARMAARLAEALTWLPAGERAVLSAAYGADEPTITQIAARLGVKSARARQWQAAGIEGIRARFRLRAAA
jgi:RNA polymerase sigma factor (sigma-70 family)